MFTIFELGISRFLSVSEIAANEYSSNSKCP
jgi:hypothetical protein